MNLNAREVVSSVATETTLQSSYAKPHKSIFARNIHEAWFYMRHLASQHEDKEASLSFDVPVASRGRRVSFLSIYKLWFVLCKTNQHIQKAVAQISKGGLFQIQTTLRLGFRPGLAFDKPCLSLRLRLVSFFENLSFGAAVFRRHRVLFKSKTPGNI